MKKEIRVVNEKERILQVTTVDERWYVKEIKDKAGLPSFEYVPSVTWITDHYPKGIAFYKWLANKGWNEAEALKEAAAGRGSKVHQAVANLIDGQTINIYDKYVNPMTDKEEEFTLEEYEAIMSFAAWHKENEPEIIDREFTVWGDGYAGTVDLLCRIKDKVCLIDLKTSQYIWPNMELQISAYKEAIKEYKIDTLAILQLGYKLNKKKFKYTEIEHQYNEFLAAKTIWAKEQKNVFPKQKDYPLDIKL